MSTKEELAELADTYYDTRNKRLTLEREARVLKSREDSLMKEVLHVMTVDGVPDIEGSIAVLHHVKKTKHIANDWELIHKYIYEENAIDLVQRRLTDSAVNLRLEDGITIPGISTEMVDGFEVLVKREGDE